MLGIPRAFSFERVGAASSRSSSLVGGVSSKGRSRGRNQGCRLLGKRFSGKRSIWVSPFVSRANHLPGPDLRAKEGLATESGSRTLPGGSNAQDHRCNENLARRED